MKIDGRQIADKLFLELRTRVGELLKKNITPHLAVILVGENPASVAYVLQKQKQGEKIGTRVSVYQYTDTVTNEKLLKKLRQLNEDNTIHGILIQRPLPPHIDVNKLEIATAPQKDIDGFHPDSPFTLPLPLAVVKILEEINYQINPKHEIRNPKQIQNTNDQNLKHLPANRQGFEHLNLEHSNIFSNFDIRYSNFLNWLRNKSITVLGKGDTGGGPIINYFNKLNINHRIIDSKTKNPNEIIKKSDIIISAVGKENTIKLDMLKKGVILISIGTVRGIDGKLHGDYDEEQIKDIASFYTPTPGGVGPVNVAMLLKNLVTAAEKLT